MFHAIFFYKDARETESRRRVEEDSPVYFLLPLFALLGGDDAKCREPGLGVGTLTGAGI